MRMHSYPLYQDLQQQRRAAGRGAVPPRSCPASVSIDNQTERVEAEMVSGNYFTMLGVKPAIGRVFNSRGGRSELSGPSGRRARATATGTTRFARDPSVVGKKILVERLSDDDRRRVGRRVRRDRPGAVAADPRARS